MTRRPDSRAGPSGFTFRVHQECRRPSFVHSLRLPAPPRLSLFTLNPCPVTWVPSDKEEAPFSPPLLPLPNSPPPPLLRPRALPNVGSISRFFVGVKSKAVEGVGIYCGKSILGKAEKQWSRMLRTQSRVALLNKHTPSEQSIHVSIYLCISLSISLR